MGQNFENLVYLQLLQRHGEVLYKHKNKKEVDFFIKKTQSDIQVCRSLNDDNFEREIYFSQDSQRKILIVYEVLTKKKLPPEVELTLRKDFFL